MNELKDPKQPRQKYVEYKDEPERVILVTIDPSPSAKGSEAERSLDELAELVETAGAEPVFYVTQFRDKPHPGTYVGSGKLEELRLLIEEQHATGIVCDDELSPAQMKNLGDALNVKIMDRTMVILDIFAKRAASREGKLQVELAQLRYTASHLTGMWKHLSRQEGGIGMRGPGEKQLEMDRRIIGKRISFLKAGLKDMTEERDLRRKKRSNSNIPVAAIVGYTNAGKSSLLNVLTHSNVLEEDKLFATLDPTTRVLQLPDARQVLLTDTVGFVRKLPHHLIDAFHSTLEEACYADFLIHVVDASDPQMDREMEITYKTLSDLGVTEKPIITIFNKMDLHNPEELDDTALRDPGAAITLKTSLKPSGQMPSEEDLSPIYSAIGEILRRGKVYVERLYAYENAGQIQQIRKCGELLSEEYTENGIFVRAYIPEHLL